MTDFTLTVTVSGQTADADNVRKIIEGWIGSTAIFPIGDVPEQLAVSTHMITRDIGNRTVIDRQAF